MPSEQVVILHLGETYFVLKAPQLPSPAKFISAVPAPLASGGPWTGWSPNLRLPDYPAAVDPQTCLVSVSHLIVEGLGWLIFKELPCHLIRALGAPQTSMGHPAFLKGGT